MALPLTYFCGMAASAYIAVCLCVAAVRWFHMCRPYDRNPRYYYPARPHVTSIYLSSLLLLPYALHPESPDAWYLTRFFFLPVAIYHFTLMLYAYFGNVMQWGKWRKPMIVVSVPILIPLAAAFILAIWPGAQVGSWLAVFPGAILYVLGAVISGVCIGAMILVLRWARRFDSDDFSNMADFPVIAARLWVVMVVVDLCICWVAAIWANPAVMAVVMLVFAGCSVAFIITALHPHRTRPVQLEEETEEAGPRPVSKKKHQAILAAIHTVVVEQEAYLDAHLTIQDVADRCGYSRSALSGLFKAELGGFFTYVNRLRLQHVDTYRQEHPSAPLQEAVLESGFNSRQAYYTVKSRLSM
jgi:AraC-like DNA-binding protein